MASELFPESDEKFAKAARDFAYHVRARPEVYHVSPEELTAICEAVETYDLAFRKHSNRYTRSMQTRIAKDMARAEAEKILRTAAAVIRARHDIPDNSKELLGIKLRPKRLGKRRCPQKKPLLRFKGVDGGTVQRAGTHVIEFGDGNYDLCRPGRLAGAERLELFVDLVPLGEKIPTWPGERMGGRMWSAGIFTRSPLRVVYPKCDSPMVLVYWGRWGAGNNDYGAFSDTLVTRIEGKDLMLSESPNPVERAKQQTIIITSGVRQLPGLVNMNAMNSPEELLLGEETAEAA